MHAKANPASTSSPSSAFGLGRVDRRARGSQQRSESIQCRRADFNRSAAQRHEQLALPRRVDHEERLGVVVVRPQLRDAQETPRLEQPVVLLQSGHARVKDVDGETSRLTGLEVSAQDRQDEGTHRTMLIGVGDGEWRAARSGSGSIGVWPEDLSKVVVSRVAEKVNLA
jgi:hypothetical protein